MAHSPAFISMFIGSSLYCSTHLSPSLEWLLYHCKAQSVWQQFHSLKFKFYEFKQGKDSNLQPLERVGVTYWTCYSITKPSYSDLIVSFVNTKYLQVTRI